MSAEIFIDTNVFVYCFDSSAPAKRRKARAIVRRACINRDGVVSTQVVQEFLNVATRKFERPMTRSDASAYLNQVLMPLCRVFPSRDLYQEALSLQDTYSFSFYDSLIVAAARERGCERLLSEDLQAGLKIDRLRIENPF